MASRQDSKKRQAWEVRFERFRTSGLAVLRFCEQEGVSPNTFYYWAKRVGRQPVKRMGKVAPQMRPIVQQAGVVSSAAVVRFYWNGALEASVPADCLDAIRCLAERLPSARAGSSDGFRQVVVSS